ncbi:MAG: Endonuclease/Exonuclease/phosphatase family protein [Lentisphaerae bacterium ADurb.Bin242]|nr:MAG: Endonuclease/Exonuclease/phosphatase family protein [Lentisphaerae bacterium ADurb.Bin242]
MADFSFRVMSYNLHSGIGMDGKVDYDRMANVIAKTGAELAGLQEVAIGHPKAPGTDPLRIMGKLLNRKGIFGKAFAAGGEGQKYDYGIGVLGKWDMEEVEILRLPCPEGAEPRIGMIVRVRGPEPFYFLCTHLSFEETPEFDRVRLEQMTVLMECVKRKGYFPAVLVGDFNASPDSPCVRGLKKEWALADDRELTFPSVVPNVKIDYIAWYPRTAFSSRSFRVVDETLASDHRPVIADLTLNRSR